MLFVNIFDDGRGIDEVPSRFVGSTPQFGSATPYEYQDDIEEEGTVPVNHKRHQERPIESVLASQSLSLASSEYYMHSATSTHLSPIGRLIHVNFGR